jgi:hypothetical protein
LQVKQLVVQDHRPITLTAVREVPEVIVHSRLTVSQLRLMAEVQEVVEALLQMQAVVGQA